MTAETKVAYIFPGQGAQAVGMGFDIYEGSPASRDIFQMADDALGFPLSTLCFTGPDEELRQTINAQPALVTTSYAYLKAAQESVKGLPPPAFVAGHSLGEYTALSVANVLDFTDTVRLARERGRLMHEAGLSQPGTMAAIIGLEETVLAEVCQQTGTIIANINCPGQFVISGAADSVAQAIILAKKKGASRTVALKVSGAFHSPLMQTAADGMAAILPLITFRDPAVPVIANITAQPLYTGDSIKEELLVQLINGIQWQRIIEYMISQGVTKVIEFGPGRVLTGMVKRIDPGIETVNINNAEAIKHLA